MCDVIKHIECAALTLGTEQARCAVASHTEPAAQAQKKDEYAKTIRYNMLQHAEPASQAHIWDEHAKERSQEPCHWRRVGDKAISTEVEAAARAALAEALKGKINKDPCKSGY